MSNLFTVLFYGPKVFGCKTAQFSETWRGLDSVGLTLENTFVQLSAQLRKVVRVPREQIVQQLRVLAMKRSTLPNNAALKSVVNAQKRRIVFR